MVVGEFTVSNISMEEDKRDEEQKQKNSTLDLEKFKADVEATKQLAKQVKSAYQMPLLGHSHSVSCLATSVTSYSSYHSFNKGYVISLKAGAKYG